jgi:hypothetical protein
VRDENFKGRLQQVAQERFGETPFYDSEGARVGTHREYTSVVFAGANPLGTGHGASKQEAEQDAARVALESLVGGAEKATAKPAKTARPRARRSPRTGSRTKAATASEAIPEAAPEVGELISLPEREPEPVVVPSEPRSRQFGEPID